MISLQVFLSFGSIFIASIALVVSITNFIWSRRQKRVDNLISVQQFLHAADLSDARRCIREKLIPINLDQDKVRRVCSAFDFAGGMVRYNAINRKIFFYYWGWPLRCLAKPLSEIEDNPTGDILTIKEYYKDFWWLMAEAERRTSPPLRLQQ
jgi:hypothetical protein